MIYQYHKHSTGTILTTKIVQFFRFFYSFASFQVIEFMRCLSLDPHCLCDYSGQQCCVKDVSSNFYFEINSSHPSKGAG